MMKLNISARRPLSLLAVPFLGLAAFSPALADETPLAEQMSEMNGYYKKMRKTDDPVIGAELAVNAQKSCIKGLEFVPTVIEDMPEGKEKAKALADYKRLIAINYATFCEMEIAFIDGDLEKVGEIVASLKKLKKEGHNKYIEED